MPIDLSFVADDRHRRVLQSLTDEIGADATVIGVLLAGSLARGDALPGADIDLILLVADDTPTSFTHELREGTMVERHTVTVAAARRRLAEQPMAVYIYLDGRILADPHGHLADLTATAHARLSAYRAPATERRAIAHWLRSAHIKLTAARAAGDDLRAAYVTSTTAWKILEGVWAINHRPMPPSGAVWAHLTDLADEPTPLPRWARQLFLGDLTERETSAEVLMTHLIPRLKHTPDDPPVPPRRMISSRLGCFRFGRSMPRPYTHWTIDFFIGQDQK